MKNSRKFTIAFWIMFLALILLANYLPCAIVSTPLFYYGTAFFQLFLIFGWYKSESREHSIATSRLLDTMVIVFALIAIPYYKFRYFGASEGMFFIGKVLGLTILCLSVTFGVTIIIDLVW